jgi:hypothetical protein
MLRRYVKYNQTAVVLAFDRYQKKLRERIADPRMGKAFENVKNDLVNTEGMEADVRQWVNKFVSNPSTNDANSIIQSIRHQMPSAAVFKHNAQKALTWLRAMVDGNAYCLILGRTEKASGEVTSTLWLGHKVIDVVGAPTILLSAEIIDLFPAALIRDKIQKNRVNTFVYYDDGFYSGMQASNDVLKVQREINIPRARYFASAAFATEFALKHLRSQKIDVFVGGMMLNINQSLRPNVLSKIRKAANMTGRTLTMQAYKVPNFVSFGAERGLTSLVQNSRAITPYKQFRLDATAMPKRYLVSNDGSILLEGTLASRKNEDLMAYKAYDLGSKTRLPLFDDYGHLFRDSFQARKFKPLNPRGMTEQSVKSRRTKFADVLAKKQRELRQISAILGMTAAHDNQHGEREQLKMYLATLDDTLKNLLQKLKNGTLSVRNSEFPVNSKTYQWAPSVQENLKALVITVLGPAAAFKISQLVVG